MTDKNELEIINYWLEESGACISSARREIEALKTTHLLSLNTGSLLIIYFAVNVLLSYRGVPPLAKVILST